jgi:beta-phosphoglucomutase
MNAPRTIFTNAVIFDLDGVLVDSMPSYYEAWRAAFATHNIVIDRNEVYEREGEQGMTSVIGIFENHRGYQPSTRVAEDILNTMHATFAASFKPTLFPCTKELLTGLTTKGTALGLVTGSENPEQKFAQERAVLDMFHAVVTGRDTNKGKPAPEPYELAVQQLGLPASRCCAVENAPLGIRSAKAAGLFCYAVRNTSPLHAATLLQAGADIICSSTKALMKVLV